MCDKFFSEWSRYEPQNPSVDMSERYKEDISVCALIKNCGLN